MQGTIKRVVRDRGFGFILTSDGQQVFFHRSGLQQMVCLAKISCAQKMARFALCLGLKRGPGLGQELL